MQWQPVFLNLLTNDVTVMEPDTVKLPINMTCNKPFSKQDVFVKHHVTL